MYKLYKYYKKKDKKDYQLIICEDFGLLCQKFDAEMKKDQLLVKANIKNNNINIKEK